MKWRTTLFAIGFLLAFIGAGAQTPNEYYVDGSLTTNGNGTAVSPWNRIWYAINRSPRDTTKDAIVYIKRGTYEIDSTDFLTQLYIGSANGGGGGKYLTLRTYAGDEGKVIIDGKKLATTSFYPNMLVISGASYVRLQNLVFRNLKNTSGYVVNVQNAQNIEIKNCAFDTLQWTTTSAEHGYPTVNNNSYFIHPIYLANSSTVTIQADTLRNSAIGWGDLLRDAGGNTGISISTLVTTNNTGVASNYYVALTGNDTTGSGSLTQPWRTIKRAIDLAGINYTYVPSQLINAPVTIHLRAGTHKPAGTGLFIGSNRGVNGQWFTIRNYPGESPVVDGSDITAKFAALLSLSDTKYIHIEGLKLTKMTNDSALQNAAPSVGIKDTRFGIIVSGKSSNIVIKKNEIYDMAWTRNLTKQKIPAATDNLNPLVVLGTTDTAVRNVVIDSNLVHDNVPGYSEAVTINGNVDSFAVTNNEVYDNANIGIVAAGHYQWIVDDAGFSVTAPNNYSKNGYIRSNTVYRNISPIAISAGIYLDGSSNVTVEDNESYKNGVGLSVGNEQSNSTSGGHLIQNNVFRDNLGAGMYYGSTNSTSMVQNCVAKWNTLRNNYILDSVLRARANNQYGITNASQRYTELNVYRLQNSTFEENTIESLSNIVLGFYLTQSGLTFRYNEYYVISEDACQAIFVRDNNNDGGIVTPTDDIFTTFHQYGLQTGYDHTSSCEGQNYSATGCGTSGLGGSNMVTGIVEAEMLQKIAVYPNPVVNNLTVRIGMKGKGTVKLELFDIAGRLLLTRQQQLAAGNYTLGWDNIRQQGVTTGVYLLKVSMPTERKIIRLLVQ
ncbi:T9SS type A sorting domain-containing protein [Pseudoflavitalea sp. X16]|uniref:right-handed parallel beta-helix repeat-containing protein n=1 Tax=Paraflavitalea devenefica TaxID=2716334 RepID=UPI001422025A|nr:T9SS type A sorting domain-containing protein [Paraflavitalea devenefica]NII26994.1 T9SS type A sorting domain-containing protein [Paraflavitalea devenefica]